MNKLLKNIQIEEINKENEFEKLISSKFEKFKSKIDENIPELF